MKRARAMDGQCKSATVFFLTRVQNILKQGRRGIECLSSIMLSGKAGEGWAGTAII